MRWIALGAAALLIGPSVPSPGQERQEGALFKKCDSQIPWISDGVEMVDGTPKPPIDASVDRVALLDRAKNLARVRNRLVLWYCMRVPGTHTYRAAVLDTYMRVALFTDPGLVDLVNAKFVPLRMACDDKVSAATGVKFPEFVEPGFVVLTPDGRIVHTIDRIRTFNADWARGALVAILRKNGGSNAPAGESVEDLIRGGDDEKALERATPDQKAAIYRHAGQYREVLDLACAPLHKGIALLALQDVDGARKILEKEESAEALFYLARSRSISRPWNRGGGRSRRPSGKSSSRNTRTRRGRGARRRTWSKAAMDFVTGR